MDQYFTSLLAFYERSSAFGIAAAALVFVGLLGYWRFLTGRDDDIDKF